MAVRRAPPEVLSDEQRLRLAAEFDHERAEMFFANAVVLVEGETERQSLPIIFRSLGHDVDALGIDDAQCVGVVAQAAEDDRQRLAFGFAFDEHHGVGEEHLAALVVELGGQAQALRIGRKLGRRAADGHAVAAHVEADDLSVMDGIDKRG